MHCCAKRSVSQTGAVEACRNFVKLGEAIRPGEVNLAGLEDTADTDLVTSLGELTLELTTDNTGLTVDCTSADAIAAECMTRARTGTASIGRMKPEGEDGVGEAPRNAMGPGFGGDTEYGGVASV